MKIIFLDIDGVLNSLQFFNETIRNRSLKPFPENAIDINTLPYLGYIVEKTGAKVVLSSTWRRGYPTNPVYIRLVDIIESCGVEVIDVTPSSSKSGDERGNEIRDWLSGRDDIESFVIIDDDNDMCEFTYTNLVQCDSCGLSLGDAEKAITILNS